MLGSEDSFAKRRFDFFHFFASIGNMKVIKLKNVIWKEGKFYVAQCLNVDVSSFGKTRKEALTNIKEAVELYFEDVKTPSVPAVTSLSLVETSFQYA